MISVTNLETRRLLLRPLIPADAADVLAYASDEAFGRHLDQVPYPYTMDDAVWFVEHDRPPTTCELAITLGDKVIGAIAVRHDEENRVAELGYGLGQDWWGNGYATEAARALLTRVWDEVEDLAMVRATAQAPNVASQNVLTKLGMRRDGMLRSRLLHRGERIDVHHFSVLRDEWQSASEAG